MSAGSSYAVVVPTVGRPSLRVLLDSLAASTGPAPRFVIVVDDRPSGTELHIAGVDLPVRVLRSGGRGPAAARNTGWRAVPDVRWVAFLDDDVVVPPTWAAELATDLRVHATAAGVQGRITVPLPTGRRPTDWERGTAGLADARWATADMAYRASVLAEVGGFDERFPRAFREDADLALRVLAAGHRLAIGDRHVLHPVRPAGRWASVQAQRGNSDDALMRRLHGASWHAVAGAPRGRLRRHVTVTAAVAAALIAAATGRRHVAGALALVWLAGTAEFAAARIAPGPRGRAEVTAMAATSVAIPPAATWHRLRGELRHRGVRPAATPARPKPAAVLLDRDGTLVRDVPYNGDPRQVRPLAGARIALDRLRAAGIPLALVTNQSGIARGWLTAGQVDAVNDRVAELLGPFDVVLVCPHGPDDGCACRKPAPGLVKEAAERLGVDVTRCVLIGDIGSDVEAAQAAGARAVLVPTPATRSAEVAAASTVAPNLAAAVDVLLGVEAPGAEPFGAEAPAGGR